MTETCEKLVAKARRYELDPKDPYAAREKSDADIWYEVIHDHWVNNLQPTLKRNGELFIEYWPVWFIADREHALQKGMISGDFHDYEYGTYGTGYVCLTNRNLYIVAIDALTKRFPLNKASLTGFLADILSKRINSTRPFKGDRVWTLAPSSIVGASLSSDRRGAERIKLATATETWELFEHFFDQRFEFFGGIECLRAGQFADLRPKWHFTKQPPIISQAELDQRLRSRPRTTFMPSRIDPARAVEGTKMLDFHYLAEQVIQRGGAEVELDLAHAAASEPENRPLQELRWAVANMRHLLDRCKAVDEVLDTIHLRVDRVSGFADQYRKSTSRLSRPFLRSLHPLPDGPHPALVRTILVGTMHDPEGDARSYMPVAWGPDGNSLLTAGDDGCVRVWSLLTGTVEDQFQAFEPVNRFSHRIRQIVLSSDGKSLVTVSRGQGVKVWNTEDWSLRFFVQEQDDDEITYCEFDASGAKLAYIVRDALMRDSRTLGFRAFTILDAKSGGRLTHRITLDALMHPDDSLPSINLAPVQLAPTGNWALVNIDDERYRRLIAVDTSTGEEYFAVRDYSTYFEVGPRGDRVYSWSDHRQNLYVWDVTLKDWGPEIKRQDIHGPWSLSPSGRNLVCGYENGTIVIHDALSGMERLRFVDRSGRVLKCEFGPDERYLLSEHEEHILKVWDFTRINQVAENPRYFLRISEDNKPQLVRSCEVCVVNSVDDTVVVVGGGGDDAAILDSGSGMNSVRYLESTSVWYSSHHLSDVNLRQIQDFGVRRCAISADGKSLLVVNRWEWAVFDTERSEVVHSEELGFEFSNFLKLHSCAVSSNRQWIAIGFDDKFGIWSLDTRQFERVNVQGCQEVPSCVFDPRDQWIAWTNGGGMGDWGFQMRDLRSGSERSFDVLQLVQSDRSSNSYPVLSAWGYIRDLAVTPNGSVVLAAHSGGTISAWDTTSLQLLNSWKAHHPGSPAMITCAAMPDNQTVVTVARDGAVKVWEMRTGKCLASAYTDDELADCDVFPDGKRVVAVGKAGVHWLELVR